MNTTASPAPLDPHARTAPRSLDAYVMFLYSKHLICVTFLAISIYVNLACPAPSRNVGRRTSHRPQKRQHATSLIDQATSWANDHLPALYGAPDPETPTTAALPPVSDVFKLMADTNPVQPQIKPELQPLPPAGHNTPQEASRTPEEGVHPSANPPAGHPHELPSETTTNIGEEAEAGSGVSEDAPSDIDHRKNLAPVGKLILIALVMAGIITLIFCIYFLVDRRALACCCCRKKKSKRNKTWKQVDSITNEPKEAIRSPVWAKFSLPTPQDQTYNFAQDPAFQAPQSLHDQATNNVAPGMPPSRYPITARPYPFATRGSSFSSTSLPPVPSCPAPPTPRSPLSKSPPISASDPTSDFRPSRRSSTPAPLLPPSEFFCMPSPSESTFHVHSRVKSNPIFGHIVARCLPDIKKLRSGDHRKSKSVSGLVYVVDTEKTECRENTGFHRWSNAKNRPTAAF